MTAKLGAHSAPATLRRCPAGASGPAPRLRSGRPEPLPSTFGFAQVDPEQESKGASDRAGVWGGAPRELDAGDVITGVDEEDFASYAS
jgi:hypothetical protein